MIAAPEAIAAAATDLASIGSTIGAANAAAAANTTAVLAAGADQVSVAIAAAFGAHGQAYQALSAQAATFHIQFVQALTAAAYEPAPAGLHVIWRCWQTNAPYEPTRHRALQGPAGPTSTNGYLGQDDWKAGS